MPKHTYYLPQRKLVSQDDAALIQRARVPRSQFFNRYGRKTTFDAGYLIPFLCEALLPGDHVRYNVTAYVRMATALFPIFSNQRLDTFFFFVPYRILWANFVKMMGEQNSPADSVNYTIPQQVSPAGGWPINSLWDHLGFPTVGQVTAGQTVTHSALPQRAYSRIWNDWFRDQNVMNGFPIITGDGPDGGAGDVVIERRSKSHDYFTSALPWPQKFTPLPSLFTGQAPIIGLGTIGSAPTPTAGPLNVIETERSVNISYGAYYDLSIDNPPQSASLFARMMSSAGAPALGTNTPMIYADLARATGTTINALRQAWLVQDLLERDARGGTRYVELIRSHFGVISPDFRLQRPEYIGGGQTPINITPIAQTATGGGGLGALGGVGSAAGEHTASYAATEHGLVLALINIRTELAYQQGLPREWSKTTRYDFYFPALAGLGEQAILRQELYATGVDADDLTVFGYQERWHEYRTCYTTITGMFKSTSAGNIDEWHLAQQFSAPPTLSAAFLQDTPPMDRVLAAGAAATNMQYLADIMIERSIIRPVPMWGTPATLARF